MTSKSKVVTDNTPPLSSDVSTGAKVQPSEPLAAMTTVAGGTPSTKITKGQSVYTLTTGKSVSERGLLAAQILKGVLSMLEKDGLVRRYRLLSSDKTTVTGIRIQFDNSQWTPELDLRLLSEEAK